MEELVKLLSKLQDYLEAHYTGKKKLVFGHVEATDDEVLEQALSGGEDFYAQLVSLDSAVCAEPDRIKSYKVAKKSKVKFSQKSTDDIDNILNAKRKTFSEKLFELIDAKELSEVQVYTKANLDRRLFSKMRRKDYTPSKNTVLALIIGMKLNMADAKELLTYAGYAFKPSSAVDMIVSFFVEQGEYDIFVLNEVLDGYGLELLGNAIK